VTEEGYSSLQVDRVQAIPRGKALYPMGIQMGMEVGLFTVTAMLMGKLGTASLAAHEIAKTLTSHPSRISL